MNKNHKIFLTLLLIIGLSPLPMGFSQETPESVSPPESAEIDAPEYNDTEFSTAIALSKSISETTGIAMSPLFGMGALGAWQYLRTDAELRPDLAWYCNPWVWGICMAFFIVLKFKDTFGVVIPEGAKKPLTILDDLQEKGSALIVGLAVIPPVVLEQFENSPHQTPVMAGTAVIPLAVPFIAVALAVVVFFVVWLTFHAFSSIKIFSPSGILNTGISIFRGVIFVAYAAMVMFMNVWVTLAVSLLIIGVCLLIFGWTFRWNVFGAFFVKDFVTSSFERPLEDGEVIKGFSTSNFPGVKPRTYGQVERKGDELFFSWKPLLFGPRKRRSVRIGNVESSIRKGIFMPSVAVHCKEANRARSIIDLRMRFRTHDEPVRELLSLDGLSPNLVLTGIQAGWQWMKEQLKRGGTALTDVLQEHNPVGNQS